MDNITWGPKIGDRDESGSDTLLREWTLNLTQHQEPYHEATIAQNCIRRQQSIPQPILEDSDNNNSFPIDTISRCHPGTERLDTNITLNQINARTPILC